MLLSIDAARSVNVPAGVLAVVLNRPCGLWQFGGNHIIAFNRHTVLEGTHSSYVVKRVVVLVDASYFFPWVHCNYYSLQRGASQGTCCHSKRVIGVRFQRVRRASLKER